ncbi:MAG: YihY family inner membrane protein [Acidobacteria bacterium]|nr:YihY family inner membrane protein [Acidobacteriota bacterium]MCA1610229.1 YihY family inner membrane protein [Acidobacteriota bacterium]
MPRHLTALERARERWPRLPDRLVSTAVLVKETAGETVRGFRADRGADLASSLAFATLLTAVPLLATFSLVLATFFRENVTGILDAVNAILPYHTARVTASLREFVSESTTISGIGLVILVLASLRLISTIERIVNAVWGAPSRRDWLSRMALYLVILFALTLLFGGFGLGIQMLRTARAGTSVAGSVAVSFFPFAIEVAGLTLLYRFLPNALVRWSSAAIAGITGGVLLELLRAIFGLYVRALSRVNLITGSLTFILLSLISVFLVWVVILIGVELTHVLQTHSARKRSIGGIRAGRAENAIRMLLRLSSGGVHGIDALYREQEATSHEAEQILECLKENGLVKSQGSRAFSLAVSPENLTVAQIVDAVSPNLYAISPEEQDRVVTILEPIFERLDAERRSLLSATLADLKAG